MNIKEAIENLKIYMNVTNKQIENGELFLDSIVNTEKIQIKSIETLLTAYEKETEKNKEYKNLLIDMVNQFAYEENDFKTSGSSEQKIYTAGLSTLEDVFDLLDIDEGIKREDLWKLKEE